MHALFIFFNSFSHHKISNYPENKFALELTQKVRQQDSFVKALVAQNQDYCGIDK